MRLIGRIIDFFLDRSQKKYCRATEIALAEFRENIRVPCQIYFNEEGFSGARVWVEHEHLQEMVEACKPSSFHVEGGQVRDDCSHWSLTFGFGESIRIHCSWLVAYAESAGIPVGYLRVSESNTWIRESI